MATKRIVTGKNLEPGQHRRHTWNNSVHDGVYLFKVHPMDNQLNPKLEKKAQIRNLMTIVTGGTESTKASHEKKLLNQKEKIYFEVHNVGTASFDYWVSMAFFDE